MQFPAEEMFAWQFDEFGETDAAFMKVFGKVLMAFLIIVTPH